MELIERLEQAEEGSRELDAEIWQLIGLTEAEDEHCRMWCRQDGRTDLTREMFIEAWAPKFSRSLDAALTLLGKGYGAVEIIIHESGEATVRVGHPYTSADGKTAPLALCAAALRAREASSRTPIRGESS